MAMTLLNNSAATLSLGELNKNINKVGMALTRLSSGQKITGAGGIGNDSASFAISEMMREQLRSLEQDIQNVQNGTSMLKTAMGGIEDIIDEIKGLKQLAIDAANDSNTDADRATIQKEFDQRRATIDQISLWTNYNGKPLLDGTYSPRPNENPEPTISFVTKTEPTRQMTLTGNTITQDGVYNIEEFTSGNTLFISAKNVKLTGTNTNNVSIVGPPGGNANLWIEDLDISNSSASSVIKFNGTGNFLTIRGENTLTATGSARDYAVVNIGGGLNIQGDGSDGSKLNIVTGTISYDSFESTENGGYGAGIGTDSRSSSGSVNNNISIVNANIDVVAYKGAGIGSGGNGGIIGNITVINSGINLHGQYNAGIGSGQGKSSCGNITIESSNITSHSIDTGIGAGFSESSCRNIKIMDSKMQIINRDSACIGSGDANSPCGNIYISGCDIDTTSQHGAGIGSGRDSKAPNITIVNATKIKHTAIEYEDENTGEMVRDGAAIGSGLNGEVSTIRISYDSLELLDASEAYQDNEGPNKHKIPGIGHGRNGTAGPNENIEPIKGETLIKFNPLTIHHGTKANQAINFYINSMHTSALKGEIPNERDNNTLQSLTNDKEKYAMFSKIINEAKDKTLNKASVRTQHDANVTIRIVDGALDYALKEATYVGAYLQRLEYTEENVVEMDENVQAAESTIRDADMAKEITEYTKFNVLTQSAQAMLAQANQNLSGVLSLLQ